MAVVLNLCADSAHPSVRVEKVTALRQTAPKTYVGTVEASETVNIVARISGILWKAMFKEGSLVKKGDQLFQIEDTIYRENVNIAKATLEQTLPELEYASREMKRHERLFQSQATSRTTYESALRSHQVNLGKVNEARANLVLAENNLSYTKIHSPITGQIGENMYSEGNYITPESGTLATIVQFDPIDIKFSMSEADFFKYSRNGKLPSAVFEIIRADGTPFKRELKVDFIDNQVDSQTGTLMVQLAASNPDMELLPGGYVMVRLRENFETARPAVNVMALMTDGRHHYVFVVGADSRIERRQVVIGSQVKDKQIILSGLKEGETVVVGGIQKVKSGDLVNPVSSGTAESR